MFISKLHRLFFLGTCLFLAGNAASSAANEDKGGFVESNGVLLLRYVNTSTSPMIVKTLVPIFDKKEESFKKVGTVVPSGKSLDLQLTPTKSLAEGMRKLEPTLTDGYDNLTISNSPDKSACPAKVSDQYYCKGTTMAFVATLIVGPTEEANAAINYIGFANFAKLGKVQEINLNGIHFIKFE